MSSTVKTECEALIGAVIPFAEQMLRNYGELAPFGSAMTLAGEVKLVASHNEDEQVLSAKIVEHLKQGFRQGARSGEYKVTALVSNVKVHLPSSGQTANAIEVSLNHRDNYSVLVFFPYELKDSQLSFGETFTRKGADDIFPPQKQRSWLTKLFSSKTS